MTRYGAGLLIGGVGFALGAALAAGVVRGQAANPIDGPFTHVGIVVRDIEASSRIYGDALGVEVPPPVLAEGVPVPPGRGAATAVKRTNLVKNNVRIELVEPVGATGPWHEFLNERGEGVHHLGFTVEDVEAAVAFLQDKRGQWVLGAEGVDFAYVDMPPEFGVTLEVMGPSLVEP